MKTQAWIVVLWATALLLQPLVFAAAQEAPRAPAGETQPATPKSVDPPVDGNSPTATAASAQSLPDAANPGGVVLPNKAGVPTRVPNTATLEAYLEFERRRGAGESAAPAAASISSIRLDGTAGEKFVDLTATFVVEVSDPDRWIRVPLGMAEATLTGFRVEGPGQAVEDSSGAEAGLFWWFRGRGSYTLTLNLLAPHGSDAAGAAFGLTLPRSAVTSCRMKVNSPRAVFKGPPRSAMVVQNLETATIVDVYGLGTTFELSWQEAPISSASEPTLEVASLLMVAFRESDSITIDCTQRIQPLQGAFESLRVTLPAGAELLQLTGTDVASFDRPNDGPACIVKLKQPLTQATELRWLIRLKDLMNRGVAIEGFEVDRAAVQTGFVGVSLSSELRLVRQPNEDRFVERSNLADAPSRLRQSDAVVAYQFLRQPFRLMLSPQRIEPTTTGSVVWNLHTTPDQWELIAELGVQVSRGVLRELVIPWRDFVANRWTLEPIESTSPLESVVEPRSDGPPGEPLRLHFVNPVTQSCRIRLHAIRPAPTSSAPSELSLPTLLGITAPRSVLQVASSDSLEVNVSAVQNGRLTPLPLSTSGDWLSTYNSLNSNKSAWQVSGVEPRIQVVTVNRPATMTAGTRMDVVARQDSLVAIQRWDINIEHQRVSEIEFPAPTGVDAGATIEFSMTGVGRLPATFNSRTGAWRVSFDAPRSGRLSLIGEFSRRVEPAVGTASKPRSFSLPLWMPAGAEPIGNPLVAVSDQGGWTLISPSTEEWRARAVPGEFEATGPGVRRFEASLAMDHPDAQRPLTIRRCLITSVQDSTGLATVRAQYRVQGTFPLLRLQLPANVSLTSVTWDDGPTDFRLTQLPDGTSDLTINRGQRAADGRRSQLLTVELQEPGAAIGRLADSRTLAVPVPEPGVVCDEVVWDLHLPRNEHMLTVNPGYSLLSQWEFNGWYFGRETALTPEAAAEWIGDSSSGPLPTGNRYVFVRNASVAPISLTTMSQSAVVLFGAGLSLLMGLMLIRWRSLRRPLTFLVLGLAMAIVSVWQSEAVKLLIQPALLGCVLAALAARIDSWMQSRRRRPIVSLPQSGERMAAIIDSELATAVNAVNAARQPVEPLRASDVVRPPSASGSGAMSSASGVQI
jgi:hypothetical protein